MRFNKDRKNHSENIMRLCNTQENDEKGDILLKYMGVFKDNSKYWEEVEKEIQKDRDHHLISEEIE